MPAADMTAWTADIVARFKVLLDVSKIPVSGEADEDPAPDGENPASDRAKLRRAAMARNGSPDHARVAHEALASLAFDGYQDWCDDGDDAWLKNCLGQVLDDEQSRYLVAALVNADQIDLTAAVQKMADEYRTAWQTAAEDEATQEGAVPTAEGLVPGENTESWKYSRTPGTRYYIYRDGQYLYSDNKNATLPDWATAQARDSQAAARATEWEPGSGIYCTPYLVPAHVGDVTHIFARSKDGPWTLTRAEAADLLTTTRQAIGVSDPIEPYFTTGHYTRYHNGTYTYGETRDAATWHPTYQQLLDTIAARTAPRATEDGELDELAEALVQLFDAVPEAADMPTDELYEAIMRGAAGRS